MHQHRWLIGILLGFFVTTGCRPSSSPPPSTTRQVIQTDQAPVPVGPYSQAIRTGNMLFIAGQIGLDPTTKKLVAGGIIPETQQALENIQAILDAAGFSKSDLVQVQIFLADINDYAAMNKVYAAFFEGVSPPARAAVQVAHLPLDARIEIMATAVRTR